MLVEDYAKTHEIKTGDELLRLSLDSQQLIPEAAFALTNELSRRGIDNPETLHAFREEEKQRKHFFAKALLLYADCATEPMGQG